MSATAVLQPVASVLRRERNNDRQLARVAEHVSALDYGEVRIVVTGGKIAQVDKIERERFDISKD